MNRKAIHFVGIKGAGMTALAIYCKEKGYKVSGSDFAQIFTSDEILKKNNIPVFSSFAAKNITSEFDLVVYSGAFAKNKNPEIVKAKSLNITTLSLGEAVGKLTRNKKTVCIAGTHGKTTTTALLATVVTESGLDPSYLFGASGSSPLNFPGHYGQGEYFIVEGDEYQTALKTDKKSRFLWLSPQIVVLNNIEYDHPDVFADMHEVLLAFTRLLDKIPRDGLLIYNGDDTNVRSLSKHAKSRRISFGKSTPCDYVIKKYLPSDTSSHLSIATPFGLISLKTALFGWHNMYNIAAVCAACCEIGISRKSIHQGVKQFTGTKRRIDFQARIKNNYYYDDYAHHPTEIKATLSALKDKHPGYKLIAIFQPHTYSRTQALLNEFASCFAQADEIIITEIFSSTRENRQDFFISGSMLVQAVARYHPHVIFKENIDEVVKYMKSKQLTQTIVVTMGAGDIYKLHHELK